MKLLSDILEREHLSSYKVSKKMGRTSSYIYATIRRGSVPTVAVLAEMLDAMGYELVIKKRDGSKEIIIEPPEKD